MLENVLLYNQIFILTRCLFMLQSLLITTVQIGHVKGNLYEPPGRPRPGGFCIRKQYEITNKFFFPPHKPLSVTDWQPRKSREKNQRLFPRKKIEGLLQEKKLQRPLPKEKVPRKKTIIILRTNRKQNTSKLTKTTLYRAWQINGINNTNRINNRLINRCKLDPGLIQINNRLIPINMD